MSTSAVGSSNASNPFAFLNGSNAASGTSSAGSSAASSSSSSSTSGSSSGSIGGLTMNDFLTLMTAQLQNQDPLNPTDSNQFLAQLSELSTVEGISQLNTSMSTLSNSMLSSQALTSASLVGSGVLAPAARANYTSGQAAQRRGAGAERRDRRDADDQQRRRARWSIRCRVPATAGLQNFSWNGTTTNGQPAPSGSYSIAANAVVGGTSQTATHL